MQLSVRGHAECKSRNWRTTKASQLGDRRVPVASVMLSLRRPVHMELPMKTFAHGGTGDAKLTSRESNNLDERAAIKGELQGRPSDEAWMS